MSRKHTAVLRALPLAAGVVAMVVLLLQGCGNGAGTGRYQTQAGGYEVLDRQTGLVWQRCAEGQGTKWPSGPDDGCLGTVESMSWGSALEKAQVRAKMSGKAWRLPTVHELNSLVDADRHYPAMDIQAFPAFWERRPLSGERSYNLYYFWSANAYDNDPMRGSAWIVDFVTGSITNREISAKAHVRLVRNQDPM